MRNCWYSLAINNISHVLRPGQVSKCNLSKEPDSGNVSSILLSVLLLLFLTKQRCPWNMSTCSKMSLHSPHCSKTSMIFCTSAASAIFFMSVTLPETFQTTPGGGLISFPNQRAFYCRETSLGFNSVFQPFYLLSKLVLNQF